jgi:hypothetical protein
MQILFTRSNKIGSKIIRWGLGEPVSHAAIRYDDYVVHSYMHGVTMTHISEFLKHSEVVYTVTIPNNVPRLFRLFLRTSTASYDIGALLYLTLHFGLRKMGIPSPKKNLWQTSGMYLCTEWVSSYLDGEEDSMITPYALYLRLTENT